MKRSVIFLGVLFIMLTSFGQTAQMKRLDYEVIVFNRVIGTLTATRTVLNGRTDYRMSTDLSVRIIKQMSFRFFMESSFDDSKLVHADLKNWMNEKLSSSTSVNYDGSKYVFISQDGEHTLKTDHVDYSSASLYFEEPVGRDHVFSEKFGIDLPVEQVGQHRYLVTLTNGDKNYYQYENGQVMDTEFNKRLINIRLKRKILGTEMVSASPRIPK